MTVKELSQLYYLRGEIETDRERLADLERKAGEPSGSNLSGVPGGAPSGFNSRTERYAAEITDLQAIIRAKQRQCIHERARLERWICDIPDSLLRQIFTLRFVHGLTWVQVAVRVGGGNTDAGVKMQCYRYLDKINGREKRENGGHT